MAQIDLGSLFPKPMGKPVTVGEAWGNLPELDLSTPVAWATNKSWVVSKYIPLIKPGKSCDDVHPKKAGYNLIRILETRPSPTVPKTCTGGLFAGLLHPKQNRYLAVGELKRIGSFSDSYQFCGKFQYQWARIGNSVPPLFMYAIAAQIRHTLWGGG